jgi:phosphatidate phosphatase PAH1
VPINERLTARAARVRSIVYLLFLATDYTVGKTQCCDAIESSVNKTKFLFSDHPDIEFLTSIDSEEPSVLDFIFVLSLP